MKNSTVWVLRYQLYLFLANCSSESLRESSRMGISFSCLKFKKPHWKRGLWKATKRAYSVSFESNGAPRLEAGTEGRPSSKTLTRSPKSKRELSAPFVQPGRRSWAEHTHPVNHSLFWGGKWGRPQENRVVTQMGSTVPLVVVPQLEDLKPGGWSPLRKHSPAALCLSLKPFEWNYWSNIFQKMTLSLMGGWLVVGQNSPASIFPEADPSKPIFLR